MYSELSYMHDTGWWTAGQRVLDNDSSIDPIYPNPPLGQDMTQGQFLKRSLASLNSEFSFS